MGKKPRSKPQQLAAKLRTIRRRLCYSQSQMVRLLTLKMGTAPISRYELSNARISEYELGIREPNLLVLLAYARAGDVTVDELIDDNLRI
jgi:transcriptional regulator with XRE-family HTH domain